MWPCSVYILIKNIQFTLQFYFGTKLKFLDRCLILFLGGRWLLTLSNNINYSYDNLPELVGQSGPPVGNRLSE